MGLSIASVVVFVAVIALLVVGVIAIIAVGVRIGTRK